MDLVADDLPDREVSCESCHTRAPHNNSQDRALLNGHVARLACETFHIKALQETSVVLRDWVHPTWNAAEGSFEPTDIDRSGAPGKGLTFLWFNGNGTFLAAVMALGESRIYPFKLFNALMYEDMGNQGPFGAMILPFDYPVYYETGDSRAAVAQAVRNPIVARMYQTPFKLYMMDDFMAGRRRAPTWVIAGVPGRNPSILRPTSNALVYPLGAQHRD